MHAADTIDPARCALVLVDYQARLMPAIHGGEAAVGHALRLAQAARRLGLRVVGTEQNPAGLGPNVEALRALCGTTLAKTHFDACEDGLPAALDAGAEAPPAQVVIAGCEAHVCLLQTALGLLRRGRRVWVVEPACGSRRAEDHRLAMQRLAAAGATPVAPEMVFFEWLQHCRHAHFKDVLRIVKDAPLPAPAGDPR